MLAQRRRIPQPGPSRRYVRRTRPAPEALEGRVALSFSVAFESATGALVITGTDAADRASVGAVYDTATRLLGRETIDIVVNGQPVLLPGVPGKTGPAKLTAD